MYFGNTEILKIYDGSTKIYEKITDISGSLVWAPVSGNASNPEFCRIDKTLPYSFTNSVTIMISLFPVPSNYNTNLWNSRIAYQAADTPTAVGTSTVTYTLDTTTNNYATMTINLTDPSKTTAYLLARRASGTIANNCFSVSKTTTKLSANTAIPLTDSSTGIGMSIPAEGLTTTIVGKRMRFVGYIGDGTAPTSESDAERNARDTFDETLVLTSSTQTIVSVGNATQYVSLRHTNTTDSLQIYAYGRSVAMQAWVWFTLIILY